VSLPKGRHGHGLRRATVREAVRGSYDAAKAANLLYRGLRGPPGISVHVRVSPV
jgi:hypothetical protein